MSMKIAFCLWNNSSNQIILRSFFRHLNIIFIRGKNPTSQCFYDLKSTEMIDSAAGISCSGFTHLPEKMPDLFHVIVT